MKRGKLAAVFLAAVTMLGFAASVGAVDGIIEINQAKVLAAGPFPYTIGASGSYRLTGNLTAPAGKDAIDVTASNVTIDLNGFTIFGGGNFGGINATSGHVGTTVENGTVTGFQDGVTVRDNSIVKSVHADSNSNAGIAAGLNSVIEGCTANSNASGIQCSSGCMISANTLNNNSFEGIFISGTNSLIIRNTISDPANFALDSSDKTTGYGENIINGTVSKATSLGHNLCSGVVC
jgi:parallel beta-helix repeat protein